MTDSRSTVLRIQITRDDRVPSHVGVVVDFACPCMGAPLRGYHFAPECTGTSRFVALFRRVRFERRSSFETRWRRELIADVKRYATTTELSGDALSGDALLAAMFGLGETEPVRRARLEAEEMLSSLH